MQWTFTAGAKITERRESSALRFEVKRFAGQKRLVWSGGASGISGDASVLAWGDFALVHERARSLLFDARQTGALWLDLPAGYTYSLAGDALCAANQFGVLAIPLVDLESLAPGAYDIAVAVALPQRRAERRITTTVVAADSTRAMLRGEGVETVIDAGPLALRSGMTVVLADELWPGTFAQAEAAGRGPQDLRPALPERIALTCTHVAAPHDPAAGMADVITFGPEHAGLLRQVSADDDDARAIVVDLLLQRGELAAEAFALLRAGKPVSKPRRRLALGPLVHFFNVEFHGGLPWSATLIRNAPVDPEAVDTLLGDARLAMLATLRQGKGPLGLYHTLLGRDATPYLRRVEAPTRATLELLCNRPASMITHLDRVPLQADATSLLGADGLAAITHLELVPATREERAVAKAAAQLTLPPGRHVTVATESLSVARVLFERVAALGVASLTIGGVTWSRGGVDTVPGTEGPLVELAREIFG